MMTNFDIPPNSLMDLTTKEKGVGAHSLAHNTLGVERRAQTPRWGLGKFINNSIILTNIHKLNNKLISA